MRAAAPDPPRTSRPGSTARHFEPPIGHLMLGQAKAWDKTQGVVAHGTSHDKPHKCGSTAAP
jgi:hypothetical protein